ncbi:hypothetical protein D9M69_472580 [compost metagenome]
MGMLIFRPSTRPTLNRVSSVEKLKQSACSCSAGNSSFSPRSCAASGSPSSKRAASTAGTKGSGTNAAPSTSRSAQYSAMPNPAPPFSSGRDRPTQPFSAISRQTPVSNPGSWYRNPRTRASSFAGAKATALSRIMRMFSKRSSDKSILFSCLPGMTPSTWRSSAGRKRSAPSPLNSVISAGSWPMIFHHLKFHFNQ